MARRIKLKRRIHRLALTHKLVQTKRKRCTSSIRSSYLLIASQKSTLNRLCADLLFQTSRLMQKQSRTFLLYALFLTFKRDTFGCSADQASIFSLHSKSAFQPDREWILLKLCIILNFILSIIRDFFAQSLLKSRCRDIHFPRHPFQSLAKHMLLSYRNSKDPFSHLGNFLMLLIIGQTTTGQSCRSPYALQRLPIRSQLIAYTTHQ